MHFKYLAFKLILYRDHTITNSDVKAHFRLNIKKCALCNKKVLQIKLNYNIHISKSQAICKLIY